MSNTITNSVKTFKKWSALKKKKSLFLIGKRISREVKQLMCYIIRKLLLNSGVYFWGDCLKKMLHEMSGHLMQSI